MDQQKFDIGLNAKLKEFAYKFDIKRTPDNDASVFESFGNYIASSFMYEEEVENINVIYTNKAEGIDGIAIIINNQIISDLSDLKKLGSIDPITMKIGFIQSTTEKSFNEEKLSGFIDAVVRFLNNEFRIEPFSSILDEIFRITGEYIDRITNTPDLQLYFLSARTSHNISDEKLRSERNKIVSRDDISPRFRLSGIHIWQQDKIKEVYDSIARFNTVQLDIGTNTTITIEGEETLNLLTTIKFKELEKLILNNDRILKENIFMENVRNFLEHTPVNLSIKETINDNKRRKYFPFLNNGLVILCDLVEKHPVKPNTFILYFPRIINGCQTTNMLYEKYQESPNTVENIEVVAKIISTKDNDLKKSIIFAANNQNAIDNDLQSLNDFHAKIETYFLGKETELFHLSYERLRGQYSQITPPYSKINIENMARVYISVFLQEPHTMKSNAILKINAYQKSKKIFSNIESIPDYYYCAVLYYWMNYFLANKTITLKSKTMDMHLLMTCDLFLSKKSSITNSEDKITYLDNEENAIGLFTEATTYLSNQAYLFEARGFYSSKKTIKLIGETR